MNDKLQGALTFMVRMFSFHLFIAAIPIALSLVIIAIILAFHPLTWFMGGMVYLLYYLFTKEE